MTSAFTALLGIVLFASPPPGVEHVSKHYEVYSEGMDAAEAGRILDQAWEKFAVFFGGAPEGRLRLELYATKEAFEAALGRDMQGRVEAGGYYAPDTKRAYLWTQPSESFTRQLMLHEAAHQFHFLAATGNKSPLAMWYTEGIAEYLGMHTWSGEELKIGVVPAVTLEDYPAQALKQFDDLKGDLEAIATGKVAVDRPLGWALVHWCVNARPKGWAELAGEMNRIRPVAKAWKRAMGDTDAEDARAFREWLVAHQQAYRILWVAWQDRGAAIEGVSTGGAVTACVLKGAAAARAAILAPTKGALTGLIVHFKRNEEYHLFEVVDGKRWQVRRRLDGAWATVASGDVAFPQHETEVEVARDGKKSVLRVNGKEVARLEGDGEAGMCVTGGTARFRLAK